MKKVFLKCAFLTSFISLAGCINPSEKAWASPINIDSTKYDIDNNPEYTNHWGNTIRTESFNFTLNYRAWGMMAVDPGLYFTIETNSNDITEYIVINADITDLDGNVVHQFIPQPVEYTFNERQKGRATCSYRIRDDFIDKFNGLNEMKYEARIITEKANFVYHLWNKEKDGESTGKSKEDYDISNNQIYSADNTNRIRVNGELNERMDNYRLFDIKRCSGLWIGNLIILHVYDNNGDGEIELIDFYLTDYEDGNKKVLLSNPLKFNFTSNIHIHLTDEDKTYYESLDNKVKVHIVTSEETLIFTIE